MNNEFQPEVETEEISKEQETNDGAKWWFVNLFDNASARTHQETMPNLSTEVFDGFLNTLNENDRKKLEEIRTRGVLQGDDKDFVNLMGEGFQEYYSSASQEK